MLWHVNDGVWLFEDHWQWDNADSYCQSNLTSNFKAVRMRHIRSIVTFQMFQQVNWNWLQFCCNKVVCNTLQSFPNLACQISERHFSKLYAGLLITAMYYRIAGIFRGRNFRELVKSTIFTKKTFADWLLLPPQNFMEKLSLKTAKFTKVFSLESFLLYGSPCHINFKYTSNTCLPTCIHAKWCGKYSHV